MVALSSRAAVAVALLMVLPSAVGALSWEFDGSQEGWSAQEGYTGGTERGSSVRSEVSDGVWRVWPNPVGTGDLPAVELLSPAIRRLAGDVQYAGLRMRWTGSALQVSVALSATYSDRFGRSHVFSPTQLLVSLGQSWREVTLEGLDNVVGFEAWGDSATLMSIAVHLTLGYFGHGVPEPPDAGYLDGALEIDWIKVQGMGEGTAEPPPPESRVPVDGPGRVFSGAVFHSLAKGCGYYTLWWYPQQGSLSDLDGDGDLDVVALWGSRYQTVDSPSGWLVGENTDGAGNMVLAYKWDADYGSGVGVFGVGAADLDGDGLGEVAVWQSNSERSWVEIRGSGGDLRWPLIAAVPGSLMGFGDALGSGTQMALVLGMLPDRTVRGVAVSRGASGAALLGVGSVPEEVSVVGPMVQSGGRQGQGGTVWATASQRVPEATATHLYDSYGVTLFAPPDGERAVLSLRADVEQLRWVGDLDGDSRLDVVVSDLIDRMSPVTHTGLSVALGTDDGELRPEAWLPDLQTAEVPLTVADLDGDGELDVAVVTKGQEKGVVVCLGQREGLPQAEGFYALEGSPGQALVGDVDGDGDIDLVVLDPNRFGEGGVHVLRNSGVGSGTVVEEEIGGLPRSLGMSPGYPNPFNGTVTVEVRVDRAGLAEVGVYDLLGQRVRTLVSGQMVAGVHRLVWDGRRADGGRAASGVYAIRCQMGREQAVTKVVLVQ